MSPFMATHADRKPLGSRTLPLMWNVVILLVAMPGCGVSRSAREQAGMLKARGESDAWYVSDTHARFVKVLMHVKQEQEDFAAGRRPAAPTLDFLIISGGGDFGAF